MEAGLTPTSNDDAGNDRDEASVGSPGLALARHEIGKERGEKGGGGADGLVEGDGEIPEGDVAADDGGAEDDGEGGDAEELGAGFDALDGDDLEEEDGDVAEDGAGRHMAHCEEDWEGEAIVGEEEFVEEEDADVGRVPENHQARYEHCIFSRWHCLSIFFFFFFFFWGVGFRFRFC